MTEILNAAKEKELISDWEKVIDSDGDLERIHLSNFLEKSSKLNAEDRQKLADILLPEK